MLLCITPNPAIDRTLTVDHLQVDAVNRASKCRVAAGGKGVNVARAARTLGEAVRCAGFAGGDHGALLAALLEREGLPTTMTPIAGETRACTILIDPATGHNTVINEPGPTVTSEAWDDLLTDCASLAPHTDGFAVSGSTPPGSPLDQYQALLELLRGTGQPVWVDVAGAALAVAAQIAGLSLKVNRDEAAALAGHPLSSIEAVVAAAHARVRTGAAACIITLGHQGAVFASPDGVWHAHPPAIQRVNAVASGDSFLAGLMAAQRRGLPDDVALAWGTAAGAANAAHGGGASFTRGQFDVLLAGVTVVQIRRD
jgi:1-phosphofructokinase family hexose kinase